MDGGKILKTNGYPTFFILHTEEKERRRERGETWR